MLFSAGTGCAVTRSRPRNRGERNSGPYLPVIYEVEGDDTDDAYDNDIRSRKKARLQYIVMAVLSAGVLLQLYHCLKQSLSSSTTLSSSSPHLLGSPPTSSPSSAKKRRHHESKNGRNIIRPTAYNQMIPTHKSNHKFSAETIEVSDAPLFYHISPGSTGSRTLYHVACKSGFPSVHHKSFCISQTRGIHGVTDDIVQGIRSHYEVLRLYEMARRCCSLWSQGKVWTKVNINGTSPVLYHGGNYNNSTNNNHTSGAAQLLCNMPLREWKMSVISHLTSVLQSGIVGIFDTPYPFLALQVLDIANEWRMTSPIIALTLRNPKEWANSRSKNHRIMVCREDYSYEGLGASEFDVLGCVTRAYDNYSALVLDNGTDLSDQLVLHFWDVFQIRSRKVDIDPTFQLGMEQQMKHHQETYLPMSHYSLDIFGNRSKPIKEHDVAVDICRYIFDGKLNSSNNTDKNIDIETLQSKWRDRYKKALTCRGRVDWEITNDTLNEYYHLPNTCEVLTSNTANLTYIKSDKSLIPLIQEKIRSTSNFRDKGK